MGRATPLHILLSLSVVVGCGQGDGGDATETPLPDAPGSRSVVGMLGVMWVTAYNVETDVATLREVQTSALVAGFFSSADTGDSSSSPSGLGLLDGMAIDTCTSLGTSDVQTTGGDDSAALVEVGAYVTVSFGERSENVPLADEDSLPPGLPIQDVPTSYVLVQEDADEPLFVPGLKYGVAGEGSPDFASFASSPYLTSPELLALTSPDLANIPDVVLSAGVDVQWSAGVSDYIFLDVRAATGEGITCVVIDDGAFTIPPDVLVGLPVGSATFTLARSRIGWTELEGREAGEILGGAASVVITGPVQLKP